MVTTRNQPTDRWRRIVGTAQKSSGRRRTSRRYDPKCDPDGASLGRSGTGSALGQSESGRLQSPSSDPAGTRSSSPVWGLPTDSHHNSERRGTQQSLWGWYCGETDHSLLFKQLWLVLLWTQFDYLKASKFNFDWKVLITKYLWC